MNFGRLIMKALNMMGIASGRKESSGLDADFCENKTCSGREISNILFE